MKQKIKKGLGYFILGFLILFCCRLAYDYIARPNGTVPISSNDRYSGIGGHSGMYEMNQSQASSPQQFQVKQRNYASKSIIRQPKDGLNATPTKVDQKYEKVSTISAQSGSFTEDEQKIRALIKKYNALIQLEQNAGLPKYRYLNLAIGVEPDKFEEMTEAISSIGKIKAIQVNKTDKTNEYKGLTAKRLSLESHLANLMALKNKSDGKIEELINLENQILDIERQIQDFGVQLGDFDKENEFCTIQYTLREHIGLAILNIPLYQRITVALQWAFKYYLFITFMLFFASLSILIGVIILEKLSPFIKKYWN